MNRMVGAALLAFLVSLLLGWLLIPLLKRLKFGQQINELGPKSHQAKQGTPTMGGLMICLSAFLVTALLHRGRWALRTDMVLPAMALCLGNLLIGFADDYLKIRRQENRKGLTPNQKLIPQTLLALLFSFYCYFHPEIGSGILIPIWNRTLNLGWFYIPFATFVIVATTNSANLLDGLDGLLGSVALLDMLTFGVVTILLVGDGPDQGGNLSVFAFAVAGSCLGYLRYNTHPARLLMGDTGSMFLGGAVSAVALMSRAPLLIVFACFCMLGSSLSVIIQRFYFRRTGGKRIFLSSPIHHHFELKGLSESRIVSMYSIVTMALCLLSLWMITWRMG